MSTLPTLDQSALKVNQRFIVALTTAGFILDAPALPAFVAAVLIAGTFVPQLALFKQFYRHVLAPLGVMKPAPAAESAAPHQFAQLLGGIVLGAASILLFTGSAVTGWALAWIVIFLALANLLFGFCAGCFVYFQLGRLGVPGFSPSSPRTGARP